MPQIVENDEHKALQPSFTNDYWDASTFGATKTTTNNAEIIFSTSNAIQTQVGKENCENLYINQLHYDYM